MKHNIGNRIKKIAAAVSICSLVIGALYVPVFAADQPSSWAASDVSEAVTRGFVPDELQKSWSREITREEFCRLAVKALETMEIRLDDSENTAFSDTKDEAVLKAAAAGIVTGTGNGKFSPDNNIRRQDAAVILYRIAQLEGFPDIEKSSLVPHIWSDREYYSEQYVRNTERSYFFSYSYDGVAFCYNTGIMAGTGHDCFSPNSSYTREQSVLTMLRMYRWKTGTLEGHDNSELLDTLPDDNRSYEYGYHTEGAYSACYKYGRDYLVTEGVDDTSDPKGIVIRRADGSEVVIETLGSRFDYVKFLSEDYACVSTPDSDERYAVSLSKCIVVDAKEAGLEDEYDYYTSDFDTEIAGSYWRLFHENRDGTRTYEFQDALFFVITDSSGKAISPWFNAAVNLNTDSSAYIECMYGRYIMDLSYTMEVEGSATYMCDRYGHKLSDRINAFSSMEYMSGNGANLMITSPNPTYSTVSDGLTPGSAVLYDDAGSIVRTFSNVLTANFYGSIIRILESDGQYSYYTPSGIKL